ncbi:hypothetical protein V1504DRAFT_126741 [Lipomyces starkeyi]
MKGKGKTPTPASRSTATRKQVDFKKKLLERDGSISGLGGVMDATGTTPDTPSNPEGTEILIAAHIIPFCANNRPRLRYLLSIFAGQDMQYMENSLCGESINEPSNGILLEVASHQAFHPFHFGLEYRDKQYRVRRLVRDNLLPRAITRHNDGNEIFFGRGSRSQPLPSPLFCNIHLSIGRVLQESGAANAIDKILEAEYEFNNGNMDSDYSQQVSASYHERELKGLETADKLIH